ncbi:hypothetical protein BTA51_11430 [Hahella sp. CCB-MM4]|uniref:hypothetical protein n=1 Tax=Hahella sp. (strain CCB-MM4) TaxID=1926491 RepID=UPI000B9A947E|nr:hypothetical protein [Hahella sp. CCB-MM4]OZG73101.1 hypothetical protein BTA51_11430 [Hahella sp. CCB-MM4]
MDKLVTTKDLIDSLGLEALQHKEFIKNIDDSFDDYEAECLAIYDGETPMYIAVSPNEKEFIFEFLDSFKKEFPVQIENHVSIDTIRKIADVLTANKCPSKIDAQSFENNDIELKVIEIDGQVKAYAFPIRLFHILTLYANFKMTGTTNQKAVQSDFGNAGI